MFYFRSFPTDGTETQLVKSYLLEIKMLGPIHVCRPSHFRDQSRCARLLWSCSGRDCLSGLSVEDLDSFGRIVIIMEVLNMFKNEPSCTPTRDCPGPLCTYRDSS